jgi:hypothetical protein
MYVQKCVIKGPIRLKWQDLRSGRRAADSSSHSLLGMTTKREVRLDEEL